MATHSQPQRRPAGLAGLARIRRTAAAIVVVAVLAASCGSSDDEPAVGPASAEDAGNGGDGRETNDGGEGSPSQEAGAATSNGVVDLGSLEAGGGRGSAATAVAAEIGSIQPVGSDWFPFAQPNEPLDSCRFGQVRAWAQRTFLNGLTGETIGVTIDVYDSPEAAATGLDLLLGPDYKSCAADGIEQVRQSVLELGVYDTVTGDPVGELEPSLLPDRGGATRRFVVVATGPQTELELEITSTHFTVGQAVVGIEVALEGSEHQDMTAIAAASLVDWDDFIWEPDPDLDAAVDRLRMSMLGPESPARFYQLFQPGTVDAPADVECAGPAAGVAEYVGPTWATQQGISALIQSGTAYATEAEAEASMTALLATDADCVYGEVSAALAGNVTYEGGEVTTVERDGNDVVVVDISMRQKLAGSDLEVEAAHIAAFVRNGPDLLAWQFVGVRGDEPDLIQLVLDASARLPGSDS